MAERENFMPFTPEELIEQEGPYMGCISDVDLALKAAQAEDEIRSQKIRNEFGYFFNAIIWKIGREDYILYRSNEKTGKVMEDEVRRRASIALKDENVSDKAKRIAISEAGVIFTSRHSEMVHNRIEEERQRIKNKYNIY